jgi:hypothetical protein
MEGQTTAFVRVKASSGVRFFTLVQRFAAAGLYLQSRASAACFHDSASAAPADGGP